MKFMEKNHIKKMCKCKELFDLSNLPLSSKCYWTNNKRVLGKIKDEYVGKSISKYVGLKSKMYSVLDESNNQNIASKGHKGFTEFQEFYDTLPKKRLLDTQWEEQGLKIVILALIKLIKGLYHNFMINDIFSKMELEH